MGRSYECGGGAYDWRTGVHECSVGPTIKWAGLMSVGEELTNEGQELMSVGEDLLLNGQILWV